MKDSKAETSNNITRKKTFTTFGLFWPNDKEIQVTKLLNNLNEEWGWWRKHLFDTICSQNWINFYRFLKKVSNDKILKKVSNDELFKKVFKGEVLKKVSKDEIGDKSKETAADGKLQQVKDIYNNICQSS